MQLYTQSAVFPAEKVCGVRINSAFNNLLEASLHGLNKCCSVLCIYLSPLFLQNVFQHFVAKNLMLMAQALLQTSFLAFTLNILPSQKITLLQNSIGLFTCSLAKLNLFVPLTLDMNGFFLATWLYLLFLKIYLTVSGHIFLKNLSLISSAILEAITLGFTFTQLMISRLSLDWRTPNMTFRNVRTHLIEFIYNSLHRRILTAKILRNLSKIFAKFSKFNNYLSPTNTNVTSFIFHYKRVPFISKNFQIIYSSTFQEIN